MSLYQLFKSKGPSGFGYGSTAEEVTAGLSLAGKSMLVTGCNSGLGLETLRVLALRGARVVGTARTIEKAREACQSVSGQTVPLACELSDPASVRAGGYQTRRDHRQRRHHGAAEVAARPRLRVAILHQPHRPFHPGHRAAG